MLNQRRPNIDHLPEPHNEHAPPSTDVKAADAVVSDKVSVIGTDLTIIGEKLQIISQDVLHIDGEIHGDVSGKHVTIGPEGSVTGTISSEHVDVHGDINGAVRANEVVLHPTSKVDGEIVHQSLCVSAGALLEGRIRHVEDKNELKPNLDPLATSNKISKLSKTPLEAIA